VGPGVVDGHAFRALNDSLDHRTGQRGAGADGEPTPSAQEARSAPTSR
jgi:hypothetical protein